MTIMDKIACMWVYTKEALTGGQILNLEQEEYLKKRMMSIVLCTNSVSFVDHEWVSARTLIQQEEENLSMELDFKNRCSVPSTMESIVVFGTYEFE